MNGKTRASTNTIRKSPPISQQKNGDIRRVVFQLPIKNSRRKKQVKVNRKFKFIFNARFPNSVTVLLKNQNHQEMSKRVKLIYQARE